MFIAGTVALTVLILKIFFFELVTIPSASMMPNFEIGQKLLINKNTFGFRNPLNNNPLTKYRPPNRGEPVVTQFPLNPQIMFIKRVIGLPKDTIALTERSLIINNETYPITRLADREIQLKGIKGNYKIYEVTIKENTWKFMVDIDKEFPVIESFEVASGGYFLLGDNLTGSSDSRFFGEVPIGYFLASVE